jgi:hypothetical protein
MVSFSGKGQHSQELEIITYDPAGAKFTFLKARVNESGKFVTQVPEKNECTRCHGADPRPNWQPYCAISSSGTTRFHLSGTT